MLAWRSLAMARMWASNSLNRLTPASSLPILRTASTAPSASTALYTMLLPAAPRMYADAFSSVSISSSTSPSTVTSTAPPPPSLPFLSSVLALAATTPSLDADVSVTSSVLSLSSPAFFRRQHDRLRPMPSGDSSGSGFLNTTPILCFAASSRCLFFLTCVPCH
ncbi:Os09g0110151 [Oryza sativa Japonica Group]|uniref:Os09g0110151 protein n=1 Tax=Oryza sativa subsp. japonica TaxID=39947 RepID=A0A0P0XKM2_ORYSJ|nr:Os09g0110151 [Oryza sativa Japonica Group]